MHFWQNSYISLPFAIIFFPELVFSIVCRRQKTAYVWQASYITTRNSEERVNKRMQYSNVNSFLFFSFWQKKTQLIMIHILIMRRDSHLSSRQVWRCVDCPFFVVVSRQLVNVNVSVRDSHWFTAWQPQAEKKSEERKSFKVSEFSLQRFIVKPQTSARLSPDLMHCPNSLHTKTSSQGGSHGSRAASRFQQKFSHGVKRSSKTSFWLVDWATGT